MNIEWLAGADHLVSAALNGVYQGLIITGLVAVSLRRKRALDHPTRLSKSAILVRCASARQSPACRDY